jgi:hypothetical protein
LKAKTPRGIWALRGVSIAISVTILLVIGTVVYSAYENYMGLRTEIAGGPNKPTGSGVLQGTSEVISINFTVPNDGLYPLNVTVTCDPLNPNVVCSPSHVMVQAGQQGVLRFRMTVLNVQQFVTQPNHRINGTVAIRMPPFVGLSLGVDLGGFVRVA